MNFKIDQSASYGLVTLQSVNQSDAEDALNQYIAHSEEQDAVLQAQFIQINLGIQKQQADEKTISHLQDQQVISFNREMRQIEKSEELIEDRNALRETNTKQRIIIARLERQASSVSKPFVASVQDIFKVNGTTYDSNNQPSITVLQKIADELGTPDYVNDKGEVAFTVATWSAAYHINIRKTLK